MKLITRIMSALLVLVLLTVCLPVAGVRAGAATVVSSGEFSGHFAFEARNQGNLRRLRGNVYLVVVFVSTPRHPWTDNKRNEVYRACESSIRYLEKKAGSYKVNLKMTYGYLNCAISYEPDWASQDWVDYLARNFFYQDNIDRASDYYRYNKYDSAPILFMFNSEGRDYSYNTKISYPRQSEYAVYFCARKMPQNFLAHELLHLYGAVDLYDYWNNEGVARVAGKYLPKSVMQGTGDNIDALTAYLIGWTDMLNDKAVSFLRETKGMTHLYFP